MIKVGINGLGRIGKCVFIQLLDNAKFEICAINVPNMKISELEDYLRYDSVQHYNKNFTLSIVSDDSFTINNSNPIALLSDRDAKNLQWKEFNCEYVFDTTGAYLTMEKCSAHSVNYVIMSAPPKDLTNTFIYGTNHDKYMGENIVSGSSCTTNCVSPMLKILNDNYSVTNCVFTTIHSSTASQNTVDTVSKCSRTNRSVFNNIIPHTTGASSSLVNVLPELYNKIHGTSIRVPVTTGSLVNLIVELDRDNVTLDDIKNLLLSSEYFNTVYQVNSKNLVSCDFTSTNTPTILDMNASIDMGNGKFKLMIWYDNEWSYSAQLIRLCNSMFEHNNKIKEKYYIDNMNLLKKKVVCRVDFNVVNKDGEIIDDFRIRSSIPTIKSILSQNPQYIIIASHLGRPVPDEHGLLFSDKYSLKIVISTLEKYLNMNVIFLPHGISELTLNRIEYETEQKKINGDDTTTVYVLENLRFHPEETSFDKINKGDNLCEMDIINMYNNLGNVFISDAFGCAHRKHMSIYGIKNFNAQIGYGHLMKQEVESLDMLVKSTDKKILCIMGGNKVADKMPLIDCLRLLPNSTVYVGGGIARSYKESHPNVLVMHDAFGNKEMSDTPAYIANINDIHDENSDSYKYNLFDIGTNSLHELFELIDSSDVIFWNGSLGVIEHDIYRKGSIQLMNHLISLTDKTIIIGGGETASLATEQHDHIYVSTGGGALLEYVRDRVLYNKYIPGLDIFT